MNRRLGNRGTRIVNAGVILGALFPLRYKKGKLETYRDVAHCAAIHQGEVIVFIRSTGMLIACMTLLIGAMTGCQPQPQPPQANESVAKEPSDMRTAVPLVRRLDPETGTIELEFDVPAQADDDTPPIFIGVRVTGSDPTEVANISSQLERAGVSANLHLYRIQKQSPVEVVLQRSQWVGDEVESVTLDNDGLAPELSAFNADFATMEAAGLLSSGAVYRELVFAYMPSLPFGRYRAVIRFGQNKQVLLDTKAELLIAYTHKGK